MELKKGSQTSMPKRAEASLNVEAAVPQQLTGNRSNAESVPEDPEEIDNLRISTDASTLTSVDDGFVPPEKEKEYDVSNEALYKLEEYFQSTSSCSTSRISSVTNKSSISNKHPPIQVMDRISFDSSRIPSSIFAKPATMGWSTVSNESLFSIQIGKESFARDHGFILEELDHSPEFSINEGSYSFKDLNELEDSVKSDDKLYQPEQVKESGVQLGIGKKTISKENEENLQHAPPKMKIEGFGNGKPDQALSKEKSPESSCSDCGCTLCNCFSFLTCGSDSWPCCSGKSSCCLSDCSSCGSKPSTWEWCKCRCPTWSIENIFCCLSSKSSAEFPSDARKDADTDARNWCTCFSC